ncbi:zinc finger, CCCH-type [Artemisia annua]|uniref:Zinc finger, CCCH-type n=1 Tax=Artemisia annua TaxID=35608 RepID=A0A2U1M931_ARTAN|nr:zinc finger, CCCH-type [Artemisia annua]
MIMQEMMLYVDGGDTDIGPITKDDVPLDCTDILPNDSLCQEDASMDETRVVLDTQEECLFNTQPEFAEPDHNTVGESTDICHNVDADPSVSVDVNDQDNLMDLMMSSSPPLRTDKDVEEGEISVAVEDAGKDTMGIVNKNTRSLVDYSEVVVHGNSREPAKQTTAVTGSDYSLRRSGRLLLFENNLRNSKTRNQDLVNPVKV